MAESSKYQPANSKETYLRMLFPQTQEQLPSLKDLPPKVEVPEQVSQYIRDVASKSFADGREQEGIVDMSTNGWKMKEIATGGPTSVFPAEMYKRSFLNDPMLIHIHTHPRTSDSAPSMGDLELWKTLPRGAYSYIIASGNNVSMILQTQESMKIPISSKLNGMAASFKAEHVLMNAAKEVHQQLEPQKRFSRSKAMKGEKEEMVAKLYGQKLAEVCEQFGFGYYRLEGNVTENAGNLVLNRVKPENENSMSVIESDHKA